VRVGLGSRCELWLGYTRVQDAGGRHPAAAAAFPAAQAFPLIYESPLARLSLRLSNRLRWNAGYQFHRYGEEFAPGRNYRAHTGFTGVLWSF
jgi:hypothetical protein